MNAHTATTRVFAIVLAAIAAAILLSGCTQPAAQAAPPPPPEVTVAPVIDREITEWDAFTGRLEAVDTVDVRPRVSGYVSSVHFDEGAIVAKGDLLFQIDPRPFEADVDRLDAELARARATVARATSELQRAERLRAANAISDEEHDRRASFAEESAAQVAAIEAALRAAALNLEFTRVTAPIAGRVGRAIVTEGNLVSSGPGEATLLTTVVSLNPVYAYFDADERIYLEYAALMNNGTRSRGRAASLPIRMALSSDEGFPREGRLDFLDNRVDAETGTIRARAVFENTDGMLTPGLFVRLQVAGADRYRALLIQDKAVGTDLDRQFVFVVGDDRTVQYREVALGPVVDGLRVVRSGLEAGDRVIVNGLQRVRPGVEVSPVLADMDGPPAAAAVRSAGASAPAGGAE